MSPILAVAQEIKTLAPNAQFLFVGTKKGPEQAMVEETGIAFKSIFAARWRRYFSLKNLTDIFIFFVSLVQSFLIIRKFKPHVIFSAGGFVAVPVSWVGKMMGSRIIIHQQDARIGLANKAIAFLADSITTGFAATSKKFYTGSGLVKENTAMKIEWVGNPFRQEILKPDIKQKTFFKLHDELPILLVLGGATGALQINNLIAAIISELVKGHQVVHQTGKGKNFLKFKDPNYHPYELIPFEPYAAILNLAHIVVARAGLSTIAELSATGKVSVIIPMPNSHQEDNARILKEAAAAVVLFKEEANPETLLRIINSLKFNPKRQWLLANNMKKLMPKDAARRIAEIILRNDTK